MLDQAGLVQPQHKMANIGEVASTTPMLPPVPRPPRWPRRPPPSSGGASAAQRPHRFNSNRQYHHHAGRLHGSHRCRGTTRTPAAPSAATSAAFRTTTCPRPSSRNSASARRTRASASASTATGRALTSSATTSSTSWAPAAPTILASPTAPSCLASASSGWMSVRVKFEFLGGQSWSMLTPNRKGISALPGDLFYSQVIDVNYVIGLPWTRQPGVRFLYHPSNKVTFGVFAREPRPVYRRFGRRPDRRAAHGSRRLGQHAVGQSDPAACRTSPTCTRTSSPRSPSIPVPRPLRSRRHRAHLQGLESHSRPADLRPVLHQGRRRRLRQRQLRSASRTSA